ncbi:p110_13L [African swine fever virus]|uniref:p110_13L n=1 Tax=African swine fever virus TaxID=10497 RepID=A0A8A1UFU3_ASF|nr:p110_13L [African swine fever virus]
MCKKIFFTHVCILIRIILCTLRTIHIRCCGLNTNFVTTKNICWIFTIYISIIVYTLYTLYAANNPYIVYTVFWVYYNTYNGQNTGQYYNVYYIHFVYYEAYHPKLYFYKYHSYIPSRNHSVF